MHSGKMASLNIFFIIYKNSILLTQNDPAWSSAFGVKFEVSQQKPEQVMAVFVVAMTTAISIFLI